MARSSLDHSAPPSDNSSNGRSRNDSSNALLRAAQYLRVSTEHQQYSIANQSAAIALYAAAHNLGIVRSFVDEGKSGMSIRGRNGLQDLLRIAQSGHADFDQILVYDVSRWGRFADNDEAAHYEYLCKRAGMTVRYCAEQFDNDNSPTSNLLKALKRTMAGEYSRELSVKISVGQRRLVGMGFWQGGNGPFGMQRLLVNQRGEPKHLLRFGEWKSIDSDRIVLTPGPKSAVETIRLAFDLYTEKHKSRREIAERLNREKRFLGKKPWNVQMLRILVMNPIYRGAYAYGKHCDGYKIVPPERWLVRENAFPSIVSQKQWTKANELMRREIKRYTDGELLDALKRLWRHKGKLNSNIINAAKDMPSCEAYRKHFGGINEAYKRIGYPIPRDMFAVHPITVLRTIKDRICDELCSQIRAVGGRADRPHKDGPVLINGNISVKVSLSTGLAWQTRHVSWTLLLSKPPSADITIIARLNRSDHSIVDFYVFPAIAEVHGAFHVRADNNPAFLELYRFQNLRPFVDCFGSSPIRGTA
jgi:DNA invertase Pin-like site-specific DNA recombinase